MISDNIKYDFNQIQIGITAFLTDLEYKLQAIIPDLPVFILQTGDVSYYIDKKFQEIANKELYQKIPRFVIGFEDIQTITEQNTNQYNLIQFRKDELNYQGKGRRLAHQININTDFISSNFIKALENFEILNTITGIPNVFTYEFMGNTFEGAYNLAQNSMEKPTLEATSSTRNWSVKTSFEVQLHLLTPRINTILRLGSDELTPSFDLNIKNDETGKIEHTYNLDAIQENSARIITLDPTEIE